jgi:ribosomal protein S18 acetylase RimI-like enzyme
MVTIVPITRENALIVKDVRLRALQDSPNAFSSTYASEFQLTDGEWITRAEQLSGERAVGFLAMDADSACGMSVGLLDQGDAGRADLAAMWVAPKFRRRGMGRALVDAVLAWARMRGVRVVRLMVTCNNEPAIGLYRSLGFALTGQTKPHTHDPSLRDCEMSRPVV